jgi:hypothetical protein
VACYLTMLVIQDDEDLKTSVTNLQISVGNPEECQLEIIRKLKARVVGVSR